MAPVDRPPIRVVGRYALYNEIAAGGMATIHLGRLLGPVGFARTVAVKRLHPQFAKDPEFVSMFLDEARLAARVQHPNVVATIDVVATDGELFLIMDYVRGESLSKILRTVRKQGMHVPPRIASAIMCGFLHGLHAAHEAKNERGEPLNLVHRDVSPQNVLVGADGIARVLDFGIAKAQGRIQVTRDGQIKGKLAYMPPEQLAGRELTRGVDVYASAVVMWETLTSERLFKGETEGATLAKILRDPVSAPTAVNPKVPPEFDAPLLKALSRDASKRHTTAKELALDLERCVGIASPTEVGEWVESIVGPVLSAREAQIAEIESNSAHLRASMNDGRTFHESTESDTDFSVPSQRAIRAAAGSQTDTIPMGSGPVVDLARPPTGPTATMPLPQAVHLQGRAGLEESTGSKYRTGFTGLFTTTLQLPMDRKVPILASVAGVVVLLLVVTVVVAGKFSGSGDARSAKPTPSSTPTTASASLADPAPEPPLTDGVDRSIPPPPPPTTTAAPAPTESAPAVAAKPPPTARPTAAPSPRAPAPAPAPAPAQAVKKNCDPPFTIDERGRKKYKLECM